MLPWTVSASTSPVIPSTLISVWTPLISSDDDAGTVMLKTTSIAGPTRPSASIWTDVPRTSISMTSRRPCVAWTRIAFRFHDLTLISPPKVSIETREFALTSNVVSVCCCAIVAASSPTSSVAVISFLSLSGLCAQDARRAPQELNLPLHRLVEIPVQVLIVGIPAQGLPRIGNRNIDGPQIRFQHAHRAGVQLRPSVLQCLFQLVDRAAVIRGGTRTDARDRPLRRPLRHRLYQRLLPIVHHQIHRPRRHQHQCDARRGELRN